MLGHHRHASVSLAGRWWPAYCGILILSKQKQNKTITLSNLDPLWQNVLDSRKARWDLGTYHKCATPPPPPPPRTYPLEIEVKHHPYTYGSALVHRQCDNFQTLVCWFISFVKCILPGISLLKLSDIWSGMNSFEKSFFVLYINDISINKCLVFTSFLIQSAFVGVYV